MRLETALWNIVAVGLVVACGPAPLPGDEAGETAGETESEPPNTTGDPCANIDCPGDQYCYSGYCTSCIDGECGWTPECFSDDDCWDSDFVCDGGYCVPTDAGCRSDLDCEFGVCGDNSECLGDQPVLDCGNLQASMIPTDLPDGVLQLNAFDVEIADLDGAGASELVIVHAAGVTAVVGDALVDTAIAGVDPSARATAMFVDADANLDLVVGPVAAEGTMKLVVLLGDGAGGFTSAGAFADELDFSQPGSALEHGDFDADGDQDVAFISAGETWWSANDGGSFAAPVLIVGHHGLATTTFADELGDTLIAADPLSTWRDDKPALVLADPHANVDNVATGMLDGLGDRDVVGVSEGLARVLLTGWSSETPSDGFIDQRTVAVGESVEVHELVVGRFSDAATVVLLMDGVTRLIHTTGNGGFDCVESDAVPVASRAAAGDLGGMPGDELVIVSGGVVTAFTGQ